MLQFQTPEGKMEVEIPAGVREGTSFDVQVPVAKLTAGDARPTAPGREDALSVGALDGKDLACAPHTPWPVAGPAALRDEGVALYHDALSAQKVLALRAQFLGRVRCAFETGKHLYGWGDRELIIK